MDGGRDWTWEVVMVVVLVGRVATNVCEYVDKPRPGNILQFLLSTKNVFTISCLQVNIPDNLSALTE